MQSKKTTNKVTCPFATLEQPIDSWYCKVTQNSCPIFARINLDDKDTFYDYCNVEEYEESLQKKHGKSPEEFKDGIWNAVSQEKYAGHHHGVGQWLCTHCEENKSWRDRYYFPWELTYIEDHINESEFKNLQGNYTHKALVGR